MKILPKICNPNLQLWENSLLSNDLYTWGRTFYRFVWVKIVILNSLEWLCCLFSKLKRPMLLGTSLRTDGCSHRVADCGIAVTRPLFFRELFEICLSPSMSSNPLHQSFFMTRSSTSAAPPFSVPQLLRCVSARSDRPHQCLCTIIQPSTPPQLFYSHIF